MKLEASLNKTIPSGILSRTQKRKHPYIKRIIIAEIPTTIAPAIKLTITTAKRIRKVIIIIA